MVIKELLYGGACLDWVIQRQVIINTLALNKGRITNPDNKKLLEKLVDVLPKDNSLAIAEKNCEQLRKLNTELTKRLKELQSKGAAPTTSTSSLTEEKPDIATIREQLAISEINRELLEGEVNRLMGEDRKKATEIKKLTEQITSLDRQFKELQLKLRESEAQLSTINQGHKTEIEKLRQQHRQSMETSRKDLQLRQQHRQSMETSRKDLQKQIQKLSATLSETEAKWQNEQKAHQKTRENAKRLNEQYQSEADELKENLEKLQMQLDSELKGSQTKDRRISEQQAQFAKSEKQFAELQAEFEKQLAELRANFEHMLKEKEEQKARDEEALAKERAEYQQTIVNQQSALSEKDEIIANQRAKIDRLRAELEQVRSADSLSSDDSSYSSSSSSYSPSSHSVSNSPAPTPQLPQPQEIQSYVPPYSSSTPPATIGKSRRLSPAPIGTHRTLNWRFENYYEG